MLAGATAWHTTYTRSRRFCSAGSSVLARPGAWTRLDGLCSQLLRGTPAARLWPTTIFVVEQSCWAGNRATPGSGMDHRGLSRPRLAPRDGLIMRWHLINSAVARSCLEETLVLATHGNGTEALGPPPPPGHPRASITPCAMIVIGNASSCSAVNPTMVLHGFPRRGSMGLLVGLSERRTDRRREAIMPWRTMRSAVGL